MASALEVFPVPFTVHSSTGSLSPFRCPNCFLSGAWHQSHVVSLPTCRSINQINIGKVGRKHATSMSTGARKTTERTCLMGNKMLDRKGFQQFLLLHCAGQVHPERNGARSLPPGLEPPMAPTVQPPPSSPGLSSTSGRMGEFLRRT